MKVRVAIVVNDKRGDVTVYGHMYRNSQSSDENMLSDAGYDMEKDVRNRILWAEIEIPDPPAPLQVTAEEE